MDMRFFDHSNQWKESKRMPNENNENKTYQTIW